LILVLWKPVSLCRGLTTLKALVSLIWKVNYGSAVVNGKIQNLSHEFTRRARCREFTPAQQSYGRILNFFAEIA
jgi:hypothetical protein